MKFFKKKKRTVELMQQIHVPNELMDKLIDGELPWGWVTHNKVFIDRTNKEFNYFRETWVDARNSGNPKAEHDALKSFLMYMDNLQRVCDQKGECFSLWCSEYLIGQDWKQRLQKNLEDLEMNMEQKLKKYQFGQEERKYAEALTDGIILEAIRQNPDILQKDFYDVFDSAYKNAISERLYFMAKDGKIERIKSGNSYILKIKR